MTAAKTQPTGSVGPCLLSAPWGCKGQDTHAAEKTPEHMSSLQLSYPTLHHVLLMCSMAFLPARPGKHWGLTWCPHTWPRDSCWVGYHGPSQLWSQVLPCSGLCPPDGRELGCCDERPIDACVAFAMWDEGLMDPASTVALASVCGGDHTELCSSTAQTEVQPQLHLII